MYVVCCVGFCCPSAYPGRQVFHPSVCLDARAGVMQQEGHARGFYRLQSLGGSVAFADVHCLSKRTHVRCLDHKSSGFEQAQALPLRPSSQNESFSRPIHRTYTTGRTASGLVSYGVLNGLWYSCGIAFVMLGPMGVVPAGGGIEGTISASVKQFGKVRETYSSKVNRTPQRLRAETWNKVPTNGLANAKETFLLHPSAVASRVPHAAAPRTVSCVVLVSQALSFEAWRNIVDRCLHGFL